MGKDKAEINAIGPIGAIVLMQKFAETKIKKMATNNEFQSIVFSKEYYHFFTIQRDNTLTTTNEKYVFKKHIMQLKAVDMEKDYSIQQTQFFCPDCGHEVPVEVSQIKCINFTYEGQRWIHKKLRKSNISGGIISSITIWFFFNLVVLLGATKLFNVNIDNLSSNFVIPYILTTLLLSFIFQRLFARTNVDESLKQTPSVIAKKSTFRKFLNKIGEYNEFNVITHVTFHKGMHAFTNTANDYNESEVVKLPHYITEKHSVFI